MPPRPQTGNEVTNPLAPFSLLSEATEYGFRHRLSPFAPESALVETNYKKEASDGSK